MQAEQDDKKHLLLSLIFPLGFVILLWIIKFCELYFELNLSSFGIYPLHAKGLPGIITSPLIHADWKHLTNNSIPLLFMGWGIFYFYKEIAWKVYLLVYLSSQIWMWFFFVRPAWHIGASGLVYGFGAFLFVSGIIRRNKSLMAISLLVAFLYGSMVWGILPIEEHISWEGHLMGLFSGIIIAFYYKNYGPPMPFSDYPEVDDEEFIEDDFEEFGPHTEEEINNKP